MQRIRVQSSSDPDVFYEVAYNNDRTEFACTCAAGIHNRRRPCKHVKRQMLRLDVTPNTDDLTDSEAVAIVVMMLDQASDADTVAYLKDLIEAEYSGLLKRAVKTTEKNIF